MDNIMILSTETTWHFPPWVILLCVTIGVGLFITIVITALLREWDKVFIFTVLLCINFLSLWLLAPRNYETVHSAYICGDINFYEFYSQYEVLDVQDNLVILRDR